MEPLELVAQLLNTEIGEIVDRLILIVSGFAAVGLLAMATLDILKTVLQPRRLFHRWMIMKEIKRGLYWFGEYQNNKADLRDDITRVESLIADYASAGDIFILYGQPTEDCMAGIKSALGIALMEPEDKLHELMIKAWCENADISRLRKLQKARAELLNLNKSTQSAKYLYAPKRAIRLPKGPNPDKLKYINAAISAEVTYLSAIIDSNINGLQMKMKFRWKIILQIFAIAISILLTLIFVASFDEISPRWVVFSFLGGLFAPFAHDILKNLTAAKGLRI